MEKPDKLHEHQRDVIPRIHNGCVLGGGVGTGKTITALMYFVEVVCGGDQHRESPMKTPKDLVIITTAKKRNTLDWQDWAAVLGLFADPENSYSGKRLIVDSWNNLGKYKEMKDAFFIFDEQKVVGSGAWVKAFLQVAKNNQWILLSATPADTWMDYVPVFIANGFYRNRTHFIDEHVVYSFHGKYRKIRGFYGVRHLERLRAQVLVDMPYDRHTTRHILPVEVEYDKEKFNRVWRDRWNVYDDCPIVDVAEMHRLARRVVNEDPSRAKKVEEALEKHRRIIVFYNFDYELYALRELSERLGVQTAEWNGHKHQELPEGEQWMYLVQYTAGAEGWNCITTDTELYYSLTYSHKVFEQTQGRTDRLNTPYTDLNYLVLKSNAKIDELIWRSLSRKKSFHEGRNVKF